jgi:pilus assembly protein CpaB
MQAKTMILIIVAVVCGLVATIGISQMVDGGGDAPKGEMVKLFVAATNVDIGERIDSQNVRLEEWPVDRVPEGAITNLSDLEERFAAQRLFPGEPIMTLKLMDTNTGSHTLKIPPGHRACPIKVQGGHNAGALLISPGDRVDVLVFVRKSQELAFTGTKTILRDIRVYSVGDQTSRAAEGEEQNKSAQTVMLLVTLKQAEKLTLASELGSIRLVLRHPGETSIDDEDTEATSVESLLDGENETTQRNAGNGGTNQSSGSLFDLLSSPNKAPATNGQSTPVFIDPTQAQVDHTIYVHGDTGVRVFDFQNGGERPVERSAEPPASEFSTGPAPFSQSSSGNQGSDSSDLPSFDDFPFGVAD